MTAQAVHPPQVEIPVVDLQGVEELVTGCDREAAHPDDPYKVSDGWLLQDIVPKAAIEACETAVEEYPHEPRLWFQLGRAYDSAGRHHEALERHMYAASRGYSAAQVAVGSMFEDGAGLPVNTQEAVRWYTAAARLGHGWAARRIQELAATAGSTCRTPWTWCDVMQLAPLGTPCWCSIQGMTVNGQIVPN